MKMTLLLTKMEKRRIKEQLSVFENISEREALIAIEREKSRRSLYSYFLYCMEYIYSHIEFVDNWHHKEICDILQEEYEKGERREKRQKHLMINLPIRALKTVLISEIFPSWLWLKDPSLQIQNVCATQRLATKSSRMTKMIITSDWYQERFPEVELLIDQKAKSDYATTAAGIRVSFGVDSSIIGSSYDYLICDDLNDPKDVHSEASLRNVRETFSDVISGRMSNEWGLRIIMQQRTSNRDLCQFLLDTQKSRYRHICIPAKLTKNTSPEFRKFYKNGYFFPERYGEERLLDYQEEFSGQAFASQLLQEPSAQEGEKILRTWFPSITKSQYEKLNLRKNYLFVDTAEKADPKKNDPWGFLICSENDGFLYITWVLEDWMEHYQGVELIKQLVDDHKITKMFIEEKSTGAVTISALRRELRGTVPVVAINPGTRSKIERVDACQTILKDQRVILADSTYWKEKFLVEVAGFPFAKHDALVDCLAYSVLTLIKNKKAKNKQNKPINPDAFTSDFDDFTSSLY